MRPLRIALAQCRQTANRDENERTILRFLDDAIARSLERFQNQIMHQPVSALRSAAENGSHHHGLIDAFKRLFHIGQ